jgi:hypothetical protein
MDPQGPPIKFNNFDHYCKFIIERHTRIKLDDAADITGLPRRDLEENLRQKLIRYPEINLENCYRHFILAERLFNWNFQAEDRNRIYLWHATPFSCFSYFEYAMSVNDRVKKYWRLFEEFLRLLDQRCLSVHYANWKAPITSYLRYLNPFKQSLYERLPASLRIIIRDNILYRGLKVEESWRQYLDQCLTNLDYHARFINVDKTSAYTKNCNINSFDNILTFIAYMKLHDDKIARIKALKVDENINI